MSGSEDEHSESEFYYPEKESHNETVANVASEEKQPQEISESQEIRDFVNEQKSTNTVKQTIADMKFFQRFLEGESSEKDVKLARHFDYLDFVCTLA